MKFNRLLIILLLVITLFHFQKPTAYAKEDTPTILIVHSYDISYQWTKKQDDGIRDILLSEYPKANIYTENLDAKRFEKEYIFSEHKETFISKYKDIDFDIILATDDIGLEFALSVRDSFYPELPLIFSGVLENSVSNIVKDNSNVSGVYEVRGFTKMIELMRTLQPHSNRVVIINDTSSSSRQMVEKVLNGFEELKLLDEYDIEYWEEKTYSEILDDVKTLDKNTAVYLISYHKSYDGVVKTGQIFCNEISQVSSVPMYSLGELYFGSGLIGGEFLSGNLQGEALGNMAIDILSGYDVNSIPYYNKSTSYLGVDEDMMRKYGIHNVELPKDTVIINESLSFYEQYKQLVLTVMFAFIFLIIVIMILLFQRKIIKKHNITLTNQKTELQKLYDQLYFSEQKLITRNKELKFYQQKLEFEADHDFLTGLYNRPAQEKLVNHQFQADPLHDKKYIFVFIDLDNFKYINNNMGHHSGDLILKEVARRLKMLDNNYQVSRVGGDEFVVVFDCESSLTDEKIGDVTNQIKKIFILPFRVNNEMVNIEASMGCSFYPDDAVTYDELIIFADFAMYESKKRKKGLLVHYNKEIKKNSDRDYHLSCEIPNGINNNEFYLVYQPIVDSRNDRIKCVEALLRWNSAKFGSVSPGEFIHVAEAGGHMVQLGDYVIETALSFMQNNIGLMTSIEKLSINISVVQLYEETFVEKLMQSINKHNINPKLIQLEIVESMMILSYDIINKRLFELKKYGISIAIDDFGTGYSSLSHLRNLPIDVIKIDKKFVDDISNNSSQNLIIDSIVILANSLSLTTIAEGVEQKFQVDYICKCGVDCIQGYYYSKPLKEIDLIKYISNYCIK